ncbi:glycosyltransferase [Trabulsiella odontotermitis]|uniref:glycosyltransferase family 2 protein n=1 Tax=Trabulsiella odontotermitis TaxID=379893 RepID=UPI0024B7FFC8|nr:glycosyltransferase [Trabulsiella odontotermitis]WHP29873.1 glycosyltransferase [Trabulsiella odontotermitis]
MKNQIKVSICVVTYNQGAYIGPCLESLLNQCCGFEYEIIIGDDASTDGTVDVIKRYASKYPQLITTILHEKNVGAFQNILSVYKIARGKYIAHIDGDDLAAREKISLQAKVLDDNSDCCIVSHEVCLIDKNGKRIKEKYKDFPQGIYNKYDLYMNLPFFAHSSKMFRNDLKDSFWGELTDSAIDIEIHTRQVCKGNIYHINDSLGSYRVFTGMSVNNKKINPLLVSACHRIFQKALLDGDNKNFVKRAYARALFKYAYQSAVLGDSDGMRLYIRKSIQLKLISAKQICFFIFSFTPGLVVLLCKLRASLRFTELKSNV